jgi:adenylate kinase family enzyme
LFALLEQAMPAGGVLLDGFPRTLAQAEALGAHVDLAILIDVPDDVLIGRLAAGPTTNRRPSADASRSITSGLRPCSPTTSATGG